MDISRLRRRDESPVKGKDVRIGFIGLGAMGLPMVKNVVAAGFEVTAYDAVPGRADSIPGLTPVSTVGEAVAGADIIITMLPNTGNVEAVLFGSDGVIGSMSPDAVVVDMSSISPIATRQFAERIREAGGGYLDAPVSGGVSGAESGKLSIMVGGEIETLDFVRPVLQSMGQAITLVGGVGAGQGAKLCNQVVVACNIAAVCEGFALAGALDLDLETVRTVLAQGAAQSWMGDNLGPKMISGDDSAGFRIALQVKDLGLALEAAKSESVPLPATSVVNSLYLEAMAHGEAANGNQSLYRVYERLTNRTIAQEEQ